MFIPSHTLQLNDRDRRDADERLGRLAARLSRWFTRRARTGRQ
jgi:hypothetical protein